MKKQSSKTSNNKLMNFLLENNLEFEVSNNEKTQKYFAFVKITQDKKQSGKKQSISNIISKTPRLKKSNRQESPQFQPKPFQKSPKKSPKKKLQNKSSLFLQTNQSESKNTERKQKLKRNVSNNQLVIDQQQQQLQQQQQQQKLPQKNQKVVEQEVATIKKETRQTVGIFPQIKDEIKTGRNQKFHQISEIPQISQNKTSQKSIHELSFQNKRKAYKKQEREKNPMNFISERNQIPVKMIQESLQPENLSKNVKKKVVINKAPSFLPQQKQLLTPEKQKANQPQQFFQKSILKKKITNQFENICQNEFEKMGEAGSKSVQIMDKHYQKAIQLLYDRLDLMSTEELMFYYKFIVENAKQLYLQFLQNYQKFKSHK